MRYKLGMLIAILLLTGCNSAKTETVDLPTDESRNAVVDNKNDVNGSTTLRTHPAATDPNSNSTRSAVDLANKDEDAIHELKILHWNIESGGNLPSLIAGQLASFADAGYQIIALSEVDAYKVYRKKFDSLGDGRWKSVLGGTGINDGREDDRLMIFYDSTRLQLITSNELNRYREYQLNSGRHRSPLAVHFECLESGQPFLLVQNHLARGDAEFRTEQAKGLREFARDSSMAQIAIGDFNFDYVFETRTGNDGFVELLRDGIWKWIEPEELIDTNWHDPEPDGIDNYPGSMLDFTFVAGPAKDWAVESRVVVREGDFPDDKKTSDHRPVEVIVRY